MAVQTSFDSDASAQAEAKIGVAIGKLRDVSSMLGMLSQSFQAAAGSDAKNGDLKTQSVAEMQDKQEKSDETTDSAQIVQDTAVFARKAYDSSDTSNSNTISSTPI